MVADPASGRFDSRAHWESLYRHKRVDEVSWFQREPSLSLRLIRKFAPELTARIIDVGAGASSLADALVGAGYCDLTLLDISSQALAHARERLAATAARVVWLQSDILAASLPRAGFDVWHDRAVFHFLTAIADRSAYVAQLRQSVRPGAVVLIATFAEDGPTRCSGLPVVRYSAETLHNELGEAFQLLESVREHHVTPSGATQSFVYSAFRLRQTSEGVADEI
jgi:SAM-dependent methyltransferase